MSSFLGGSWSDRLSAVIQGFPNDVCDCWEMDQGEAGWFFDNPVQDDWGCLWRRTKVDNMGQVVGHPLEDWRKLAAYTPPDPPNPFYFERIEDEIKDAIGVSDGVAEVMFETFYELRNYWTR